MILLFALATSMWAERVSAQAPETEGQTPTSTVVAPGGKSQTEERMQQHRCWDRKNAWLFAGVGAARTSDYCSTLNLRRRGDQGILETNGQWDNHSAIEVVQ